LSAKPPYPALEAFVLLLRGLRVLLDADLAALYGVETRVSQPAKRPIGFATLSQNKPG
jgi:hypothetical protein